MTSELLRDLADFRDKRGWAVHHTPRNLSEALNVEAAELLECFLWNGLFQKASTNHIKQIESELADVLIYALNLCLVLDVDPEQIIRAKLAQNEVKYPAPGNAGTFQEVPETSRVR